MSQVDFHTWTLLKGVAISTLFGVDANLTFSVAICRVQAAVGRSRSYHTAAKVRTKVRTDPSIN